MNNRLPEAIAEHLEVDELSFRHGHRENVSHHAKTILDSLNGENGHEKIELEVGGHVRVPTSEYDWIVVECVMERDTGPPVESGSEYVMYVELVNKAGNMEVSLDIEPTRGEVYNLQVSHMNNLGNTIVGP
jgi:hypothetical protein